MTAKRAPKHMGTGIYVHQQFNASELVKGDTFNDADFGDMVWNGKKWISEDDWHEKQWTIIHNTYRRQLLKRKTSSPYFKWLQKYFHSPKRNHRK